MKFTELNLNDTLQKGLDIAGFTECMPVQEQTLVHTLNGKDVYVQSQTGTGKTAAFLVTIFQQIIDSAGDERKKALIVAPTRELAEQIGKEAALLGKFTSVKIGVFYGGVGYTTQENLLKEGVDVIIGTPGRLLDFSGSGKIKMKEINILVIDEADRLFDMGFLPDLQRMFKMLPKKEKRQSMLYSATLDYRVKQVAGRYMNNPEEIEIEPESITVENVMQKLYHVGRDEKINLLLGILKKEEPRNAIIFTNTKKKAEEVAKRLRHNGYNCQYIIGDLPQNKRTKIIEQVKNDKVPYLVATDVASRGLHIDDLEMVINYDLPENSESYVHRIGRTARVGKTGKAISLVCEKYVYGLEAIEEYTKKKIPVEWAGEDLFSEDSAAKIGISLRDDGKRKDRKQKGRARPPRSGGQRREGTGRKPSAAKKSEAERGGKNEWDKARKRDNRSKGDRECRVDKRPARKEGARQEVARPPKNAGLDERLAYYSKKYGEDFIVVAESEGMKKAEKKRTLLDKIRGIFKG